MAGSRAQEIVTSFLYYLLAVGKQKQDKQPRDKGPVIRDGVRPVPRLASRTITLRELESAQTRSREQGRREERTLFLLRPFLGSCPYASYFENRMITRLRSRFPATCSRSGGVEGEYILSREALSAEALQRSRSRVSYLEGERGQRRERRFQGRRRRIGAGGTLLL